MASAVDGAGEAVGAAWVGRRVAGLAGSPKGPTDLLGPAGAEGVWSWDLRGRAVDAVRRAGAWRAGRGVPDRLTPRMAMCCTAPRSRATMPTAGPRGAQPGRTSGSGCRGTMVAANTAAIAQAATPSQTAPSSELAASEPAMAAPTG